MILSEKFWQFIEKNINEDANKLRLKYADKQSDFDINFAITQIDCRRRISKKLSDFISFDKFLFPTTLSAEQCTCDIIANFHSSLVEPKSNVLDMTCGLGIDTIFISKNANQVDTIEINPSYIECIKHNFNALNITNINLFCSDSIEFLKSTEQHWNTIFVDPARRSNFNKRLFALEDCSPDVISNFDLIGKHTDQLLIKASPMIDITEICRQIKFIKHIWIVCIKNECKEIVIDVRFNNNLNQNIEISTLNFYSKNECSSFDFILDNNNYKDKIKYVDNIDRQVINSYICEPNSGIMKCGAWGELSMQYPEIKKLHHDSHLFIAHSYVNNFPGRVMRIIDIYKPNDKELKLLRNEKINIVTRGYGEKAEQLKKKYRIVDGGNRFLYAAVCGKSKRPFLFLTEPEI